MTLQITVIYVALYFNNVPDHPLKTFPPPSRVNIN